VLPYEIMRRGWSTAAASDSSSPRAAQRLVFDSTGPTERPAHFVLVDWPESRSIQIRDFLFAPYVLEAIDWVRLGQEVGA
jgi:hypothetical protein